MKDLLLGFLSPWEGLILLSQPRLRPHLMMPLLVSLLVFSLIGWIGFSQFGALMDWMLPQESWYSFVRWLLWPVFVLAALMFSFYTFTFVANLVAAPFNSRLANKAESLVCGEAAAREDPPLAQSILPAMRSELQKLGYYLLRAVPVLILFLIPGLNLLAPPLWLLLNAWFLAIEYCDYPLDGHGLSFAQQREWLRGNRLGALGFGAAVTLMMMVPIVNFATMPAAVVGATLFCHKLRALE